MAWQPIEEEKQRAPWEDSPVPARQSAGVYSPVPALTKKAPIATAGTEAQAYTPPQELYNERLPQGYAGQGVVSAPAIQVGSSVSTLPQATTVPPKRTGFGRYGRPGVGGDIEVPVEAEQQGIVQYAQGNIARPTQQPQFQQVPIPELNTSGSFKDLFDSATAILNAKNKNAQLATQQNVQRQQAQALQSRILQEQKAKREEQMLGISQEQLKMQQRKYQTDEAGMGLGEDKELVGKMQGKAAQDAGKEFARSVYLQYMKENPGDAAGAAAAYQNALQVEGGQGQRQGQAEARTPVKTGTLNGKKVVQYSDGTVEVEGE